MYRMRHTHQRHEMKVNSALSGLKSCFNGTHGLGSRLRVKWGAKQLPAVDEGLHDEVSHCVEKAERTSWTQYNRIFTTTALQSRKKAERCLNTIVLLTFARDTSPEIVIQVKGICPKYICKNRTYNI